MADPCAGRETHHAGCACHEARRDADLAAVTAERDALRAEHAADCDLIARQAAILTAVADALKGPPPALSSHSHHDLGAVAAATVAQQAPLLDAHDALVAAARAAGWTGAGATGAELVAWVRRGEREACAARCDLVADAEHAKREGMDQRSAFHIAGRVSMLHQMAWMLRNGGE